MGDKRIGIARGSTAAKIAEPLKTAAASGALAEITKMAESNQAAGIVVGLPRGLNGQETSQTIKVRDWVEAAKQSIKLPFYWQDEALTSVTGQKAADKSGIDAAAAAVILQDFLDTPEPQRVRC